MLQKDLEAIKEAYGLIKKGMCSRISIGSNKTMYKVPSNNPNKFIIRMDIKVNKEDQ